jgi:ribonucleoside-diphosphate reductase alpha chain
LKLLCEKFQHTRFEPSGFTGNQEIPIAKSIMDYIFRWMDLRFVSGQQFPLFKDMIIPPPAATAALGSGDEPVATAGMGTTSAPAGGIAPETNYQVPTTNGPVLVDRGIYHASDAMKDLVDMGDAPSCHVCGAIMTRNGSCYRCMSCGSTSGCS